MITRKLTKISQISLKSTIQIVEIDPHRQFVCVYIPQHNIIYFIKPSEFTKSLYRSFLHYGNTHQYTSKLSVQSCAEIKSSMLWEQKVEIVKIGKLWNKRQLIAVASLEDIKMFELEKQTVKGKGQKIIVKSHKQVILDNQSLIFSIRLHFSSLYVSFISRELKAYELNNKKVWIGSDDVYILKQQFLRLTMYDKNLQKKQPKANKYKVVKKGMHDRQQNYKQNSSQLPQMLTVRQLNAFFQVSMQLDENESDNQPDMPTIIYQSQDNALFIANYKISKQKYTRRQLCPPQKYQPMNLWDQSDQSAEYDDEYYEEEKRLKQQNEYEDNIGKKIEMKDSNKYQNQDGDKQSPEQEQIIISDPLMYRLTLCQNYIIQQLKQTYTIRSRQSQWATILADIRYPCINTFYSQIQKRVFMEIRLQSSKQGFIQIVKYLKQNFEFTFIAFPTPKGYGTQNEVELTVLELQLIVVNKKQQTLLKQAQMSEMQSKLLDQKILEFQNYQSQRMNNVLNEDSDSLQSQTPRQYDKISQCHSERSYNRQKINTNSNKGPYNLRQRSSKRMNQQQQLQNLYKQLEPSLISPTQTSHPGTYRFPIAQFDYLKKQPSRMEWITENEILFTSFQNELFYFQVHPNILFTKIKKIYYYLYWLQLRDCKNPLVKDEINHIIDELYGQNEDISAKVQVSEGNEDVEI